MECHVPSIGGEDNARIGVATQSASGVVVDFIFCFRNDNDGITWRQIKDELASRFSDVVDAGHALSQLRHMKQKSSESVTIFRPGIALCTRPLGR